MNLLLINSGDIDPDGSFTVNDTRVAHIRKVLKLGVGDTLRAGIIGGRLGDAEILALDQAAVRLRFGSTVGSTIPQPIEFLIALPRPQIFKKILEFAASVAISKLTFINAEKVESSYFQAGVIDEETIRRHLLLGMEQGASTYLPKVAVRPDISVQRGLDKVVGDRTTLIVCHPAGAAENSRSGNELIKLAIGPEGGWTENELMFFRAKGCRFLTLSPFILRTDNAVIYAVATCSK